MPKSLPLITTPAPERRDAARNRAAVLDAANELIGQCGVHSLTMDALAAQAGVGKGTIFRRFGSREGLMAALLDHAESEWQAAAISGPPPLGPDAPAMDRLLAFGRSRIELTLALYFLSCFVYAVVHRMWISLPFLFLFVQGYSYMTLLALLPALRDREPRSGAWCDARGREVGLPSATASDRSTSTPGKSGSARSCASGCDTWICSSIWTPAKCC